MSGCAASCGDGLRQQVAAGTAGHVVEHDRQAAVARRPRGNARPGRPGSAARKAASPPAPASAPLRARHAGSARWSWRCSTGRCRPAPGCGRRLLDRAAHQPVVFLVVGRRFAGGAGDHDALGAAVPAAASSRRRQASKSISPAAVNGVASAVMLPESCKRGGLRGRCADAASRDVTCGVKRGKYAGRASCAHRMCRSWEHCLDRSHSDNAPGQRRTRTTC